MLSHPEFRRFLRFGIVGGTSGGLYLLLLYLLVDVLGVQVTLASTLVFIVVAMYNYLMHYHWTFATEAPHGMVLVRYLLMLAGGAVLNGLIMHFGTRFSSVHYLILALVAGFALMCWTMGVSALWVFRQRS